MDQQAGGASQSGENWTWAHDRSRDRTDREQDYEPSILQVEFGGCSNEQKKRAALAERGVASLAQSERLCSEKPALPVSTTDAEVSTQGYRFPPGKSEPECRSTRHISVPIRTLIEIVNRYSLLAMPARTRAIGNHSDSAASCSSGSWPPGRCCPSTGRCRRRRHDNLTRA